MLPEQRAEIEERIRLLQARSEFTDPVESEVDRAAAAELIRLLRRFDEIERKEGTNERQTV